jgi:hypothetical protein
VPGLDALDAEPPFDMHLHLGERPEDVDFPAEKDIGAPWYISPDTGMNGLPNSRVWRIQQGRYFRFLYDDETEAFVDRRGSEIWMQWPAQFSIEEVLPYLLGQALGLAQRLRGTVCLHASAVLIEDRAIVVTGPAGAGKSSAAAAFLRLGYPVLADDVVPVVRQEGAFQVRSSHPRLWLRPDVVERLYGSREALPQLTPNWGKRYLDLRQQPQGFIDRTAKLSVIYRLGDAFDAGQSFARPLSPQTALVQLAANSYVNYLLDQEMRVQEFTFLGQLVKTIPVRQLQRLPTGPDPTLLCEGILEDYHSQMNA